MKTQRQKAKSKLWLSLLLLFSAILGYIRLQTASNAVRRAAEEKEFVAETDLAGVSVANSQPVPELKTIVSDVRNLTDVSTIEISVVDGSEQANVTITAPQDQMPEVVLHVKRETGLEIVVQPTQSFDGSQAKTDSKPTHESSNTDTAKATLETTKEVLGVIGALIGLLSAHIGLQMKKEERLEKQAAMNEGSVSSTQPESRKIVVQLVWTELPPTRSNWELMEQLNRIGHFMIPPQNIEDVMTVIESGLTLRLPLKVYIGSISA